MATAIDLSLATLTSYSPAQRVYTRHAWYAAWTLVPHLHCVSAQLSVAPDIGKAMFIWRFGRGIQPGGDTNADWPRLTFCTPTQTIDIAAGRIGRFVKVEADVIDSGATETVVWFGYLVDSDETRHGVLNLASLSNPGGSTIRIPSGEQRLMGLELSWLLTECPIETSVVATGTADFPTTTRIQVPLGFNMFKGAPRDTGAFSVKNRSRDKFNTPTGRDSYLFSNSLADDEADLWTTLDIVEYLLAWHSPRARVADDVAAPPVVPFRIDQSGVHDDCLRWETPRLRAEGKTLWECLTWLLDRRRSLGFYVQVDESTVPNEVVLFPFPYNSEPIYVTEPETGDVITIPANDNLRTLDIDNNQYAVTQVRRSASVQFDEVLVRGGRRRSVFTLFYGSGSGNLQADWTSAEESAYEAGASGAGDYPSRASLRAIRNKQVRSDDKLARVYRYFKIPDDWDGKGWNIGTTQYVFPQLTEDGQIDADHGEDLWRPGLRLLRHLPMFKGWDYTASASEPTDDTDGAEREYQECFSIWELPDDGTGNGKVAYGHDLAETLRIVSLATKGPAFNVSCRPQDTGLGVVLDVSGDEQHLIASADFTPLSNAGDEEGHFNWKTDVACTVAMEGDSYCQALWPLPLDNPDSTLLKRRLLIDAGDGYRLDYLTPGTFVRVTGGEWESNDDGGWLRDDRGDLQAIAQVAYEWYRRERVAIDLTLRFIATAFNLGEVITTFGASESEEQLNSAITSVLWHFGSEPGDAPHTLVHTNYAELDASSFARGRRG